MKVKLVLYVVWKEISIAPARNEILILDRQVRNWAVECVLKCDGTRSETKFRRSAKRTSPFKSAGTSVQSTTGSRGVRISGSNAG